VTGPATISTAIRLKKAASQWEDFRESFSRLFKIKKVDPQMINEIPVNTPKYFNNTE